MIVLPFEGDAPEIDPSAYIAPNAAVIGRVRIEAGASVWFSATIRGDTDQLVLGAGSNLQDSAVIHADAGSPAIIGADVSIGHGAVVHGCTVEDGCLIGMNATVLNGAVIGSGSLIAAGAVVQQGAVIPPRSLVAGVPGKVRRELSDRELEHNRHNALAYQHLIELHRG